VPSVAVTSFLLPTSLYTAGTYQGVIDTPAASNAVSVVLDNSIWLLGATVTALLEFSYDGGLTFIDSVLLTLNEIQGDGILPNGVKIAGKVGGSMNFKVTADRGVVIPDHARFTITVSGIAVTTSVSGAWL
jgi:hypothetical protein